MDEHESVGDRITAITGASWAIAIAAISVPGFLVFGPAYVIGAYGGDLPARWVLVGGAACIVAVEALVVCALAGGYWLGRLRHPGELRWKRTLLSGTSGPTVVILPMLLIPVEEEPPWLLALAIATFALAVVSEIDHAIGLNRQAKAARRRLAARRREHGY